MLLFVLLLLLLVLGIKYVKAQIREWSDDVDCTTCSIADAGAESV